MIGIPLGLIYANGAEWILHKVVLHGLGRRKGSLFSFHWHEHHKAARRNGHVDAAYEHPLSAWNGQSKEVVSMAALVATHLPLLPVAPFFTGTLVYSAVHYYRVHRRAHLDPEWAREHLPWHYDHHMGPDQDANWCVTRPWFDHLMGTRKRYVGTVREFADRRKREERRARAEDRANRAG